MQPEPQLLPGDGLHPSDPDEQWRYQFEMALDSESALLGYLGLLIDYHEIRMLARFLIGTCSVLELSIPKAVDHLPKYRLRWDYASNISLEISTSHGLTVWTNGKPEKVIPLQPSAQDDLRQAISDLWAIVQEYPIWEVVSRDAYFLTVRRKSLSGLLRKYRKRRKIQILSPEILGILYPNKGLRRIPYGKEGRSDLPDA